MDFFDILAYFWPQSPHIVDIEKIKNLSKTFCGIPPINKHTVFDRFQPQELLKEEVMLEVVGVTRQELEMASMEQ